MVRLNIRSVIIYKNHRGIAAQKKLSTKTGSWQGEQQELQSTTRPNPIGRQDNQTQPGPIREAPEPLRNTSPPHS